MRATKNCSLLGHTSGPVCTRCGKVKTKQLMRWIAEEEQKNREQDQKAVGLLGFLRRLHG